ncbi:transglycosylase SLT domain-containing protein, partial [Streptomyces aureoversilis]
DINAANGVPSKGLLQMIDPTFKAYHVEGTSWDIYDPVANITAACNYAADKYGSMDNVNSAY